MRARISNKLAATNALLVAVLVAISLGCSFMVTADEGSDDDISKDSYHERFLHEDMHAMANSVRVLLALAHFEDLDPKLRLKRVLHELDILKGTARIIDEDQEIYNYALVSPYMGSFIHDVDIARVYALMDPPDFEPAAHLLKSCLACHQNLE